MVTLFLRPPNSITRVGNHDGQRGGRVPGGGTIEFDGGVSVSVGLCSAFLQRESLYGAVLALLCV